MGECGGLVRIDLGLFFLWKDMVILKGLILNNFQLRRVWWSWKDWFVTISTLKGFEDLKGLIFNHCHLGNMQWSWKTWFLIISNFERGWWSWTGLFSTSSLWKHVVVSKGLVLDNFQFRKVVVVLKGLLFWQFPAGEGMVVLHKVILFYNLHFGRIWWSWMDWFWTKFNSGGCGGLISFAFGQFSL